MSKLRKRVGVLSYTSSSYTGSSNSSTISHPYEHESDDDDDDDDFLDLKTSSVPVHINTMIEGEEHCTTTTTADIEMVHHENKPLILNTTHSRIEEELQRLRTEVKLLKQIIRNLEPEMEIPTTTSSTTTRHPLKYSKSDLPPDSTTTSSNATSGSTGTHRSRRTLYNTPMTFYEAVKDRSTWLVGLLIFQSCSSFILARNDALLQQHPVIVHFLTMLVGAGGNAGNQASVRVIRGLATGTLNAYNRNHFLRRELRMAITLTAILSTAGCLRAVLLTHTNLRETLAITSSLALIVFTSICLGAILPLLLQRMKIDPAHSSTTIQVVMDILGVVLTVQVSAWTLGVVLPLTPTNTNSHPTYAAAVAGTPSSGDIQIDDLLRSLNN